MKTSILKDVSCGYADGKTARHIQWRVCLSFRAAPVNKAVYFSEDG